MAQQHHQDIKGMPVNVGLLIGISVSVVSVFSLFVGFQSWDDQRNFDAINNYVNERVNPRIDRLENSIRRQSEINSQIMKMIESQEFSRNRQYGELKKMLEENNKAIRLISERM